MNRGDVVKPTAAAVERTRFQDGSRLRVKLRKSEWPLRCKCCGLKLRPGVLFAGGSDVASNLCLSCVEPVEAVAA